MIVEKLAEEDIPVQFLCKYFSVSTSRFYQWKRRKGGILFTRKSVICEAIRKQFANSKNTYGSPRIYEELKKQGIKVSKNTIAKYMQEMGLDARYKKRFKVMTTDSNHSGPFADRVVKFEEENSLPEGPGEILAGDITYLKTAVGFVYLAVVLDIFNREVVGWSMGNSLESKLVTDALSNAMHATNPDVQVIFHSDRGSQYASTAYRKLLENHDIVPSMSRKGNCYDNCYVESWFGSLKKEWIYRKSYQNVEEIKQAVFEYIEIWYNKKRTHSALGYQSPQEFRENYFAAQ